VILNLRLIVAGTTVGGAMSLNAPLVGIGVAGADPANPPIPAEQAAASDQATPDSDSQSDQQQAEPVHDNGLPWPLKGLIYHRLRLTSRLPRRSTFRRPYK
jgi:hypothetical protein